MSKTETSSTPLVVRSNEGLGWATWTGRGFSARVLIKYEHPHSPGIFKVDTVGGEHYAFRFELEFD